MLGKAVLRLSQTQLSHQLPAWSISTSGLERDYTFQSFNQAWTFMKLVRELGTSHKDFPQCRNFVNKVSVRLEGEERGVTKQKVSLAKFIDKAEQQIKVEAEN